MNCGPSPWAAVELRVVGSRKRGVGRSHGVGCPWGCSYDSHVCEDLRLPAHRPLHLHLCVHAHLHGRHSREPPSAHVRQVHLAPL